MAMRLTFKILTFKMWKGGGILSAWPQEPGPQSQKRPEFLISGAIYRPGPPLSPGNFEGLATRAKPSVSLRREKQRPEKGRIPYLGGAIGQVLPYLRAIIREFRGSRQKLCSTL